MSANDARGRLLQKGCVTAGQLGKGLRRSGRKGQQVAGAINLAFARRRRRRLLQDDVTVGSPEAERTDSRAARLRPSRPGAHGRGDLDRRLLEFQERIDRAQVQVRGNLTVSQGEDDLQPALRLPPRFPGARYWSSPSRPPAAGPAGRPGANTERRASISIGSPRRVPVPWASM